MEKDDKGSTMIRMGVSGWMFLLVPAYLSRPGSKAVKRLLLLLLFQCKEEGPLLRFLTMEMNERGYKIKGPHWNALHCYSNGDL